MLINNLDQTIERCPHDGENPYALLSRETLRNNQLSFKARGFLSYLLSYPSNWKFSVKKIIEEQKVGRTEIYSTIKELIEEGYMMREEGERTEKGGRQVKYFISEHPRFKKSLSDLKNLPLRSGFLNQEINTRVPSATPYIDEKCIYTKKEDKEKKDASPPASLSSNSSFKNNKKIFEPEDLEIAQFLKKKVHAINPKQRVDENKWAVEFNKIRRIDKYTKDELLAIIEKAHKDSFWKGKIISPKKVREHYTTLLAEKLSSQDQVKENREMARRIANNVHILEIHNEYVTIRGWTGNGEQPMVYYTDKDFENKIKLLIGKYA